MSAKAQQGISGEIEEKINYARQDGKNGASTQVSRVTQVAATRALTGPESLSEVLVVPASAGADVTITLPDGVTGRVYAVLNKSAHNMILGGVTVVAGDAAMVGVDETGTFFRASANVAPTP